MAYAVPSSLTRLSFAHYVRGTLQNLTEALAKRRMFQQTRNELQALSDANLADLGLTRCQIDRVALDASIGSVRH